MPLHAKLTEEIRRGPTGPRVGAFFDLDQTLLAGFSAVSFFRERLLSGRVAPRELIESSLGALSFGLGRMGFSGFMSATTAAFRGMSEAALEEIGREVFEKHLATQIYPESRAIVHAHQEAGHTVAIVSSATRYQAEPLARDLGIEDVLCTRLEVRDGTFTGRILSPTCYGEGKVVAARELAERDGVDFAESYFYTDSHEDLPLLDAVGRPRPLNPNRRLAQIAKERGWPSRHFSSRGRPGAEEVVRTALAYGALVPSISAGVVAGVLNQSRREGVNILGAMWGDLAASMAGVHLVVDGEEHLWSHRPAVFIFNHQSGFDTVLLAKLLRRDLTAVSKQEVRKNPIFGPLFGAAGFVFVDRANSAKAIEAMQPAVDALRHGRSLVISPEGTRSPTPKVGPFKKGPFHIAMQAGVPVIPIVFRNALDALPKHAVFVRPATVEAVVLPPIDTTSWTRETLAEEIDAIRNSYIEVLDG